MTVTVDAVLVIGGEGMYDVYERITMEILSHSSPVMSVYQLLRIQKFTRMLMTYEDESNDVEVRISSCDKIEYAKASSK